MTAYEEGMAILEEKFGGGKDNVISLATIDLEPAANGGPRPVVRDVDAYYENGVFYVVTWAKSSKMLQIAQNNQVALAVCFEWFTAGGTGENLGWVRKPENTALRDKLRTAFAKWYDMANNEDDQDCSILAIRLEGGVININHHEKLYIMDFAQQTANIVGRGV